MLTQYTVHASVRTEGAIGNFGLIEAYLQLESEPHQMATTRDALSQNFRSPH